MTLRTRATRTLRRCRICCTGGPAPVRSASSAPSTSTLLPPCNAGCPAGENIQAWLAHAEAGRHEQRVAAAGRGQSDACAIHGRVCYHPCESVCNRASLDSAVSIHSVERFLGDLALERGGRSIRRRCAAAGGCWSSAPGRAGFPPPTIWPGSATRSRSGMRASSPAG